MYPLWDYEIKLSPKLLPFHFQKKRAKNRDFGPFLSDGISTYYVQVEMISNQ